MNSVRIEWIAVFCLLAAAPCRGSDDFVNRSTWVNPTTAEVVDQVRRWAQEDLSGREQAEVFRQWSNPGDSDHLSRLLRSFETVDPDLEDLDRRGVTPASIQRTLRRLDSKSKFVRDHVRLAMGVRLAQRLPYEGALTLLSDLRVEEVIDPAGLLFHRSICEFRLLRREAAQASWRRLLENEPSVPRRYVQIVRLAQRELEKTEPGTPAEIAHLMRNIEGRLRQGCVGKRARNEQDAVIRRLDRLIALATEPPGEILPCPGLDMPQDWFPLPGET